MGTARNEDAFSISWLVASRLDQRHIGPEHLLLALLEGSPDDKASELLISVGLDAQQMEQWLRSQYRGFKGDWDASSDEAPDPFWGNSPNANSAFYWTVGRAEGFAAAHHGGTPDSIDLLVGLLWGRDGLWSAALDSQGVSCEALVAGLVERDLTIPVAALPLRDPPWRGTHRADIPRRSLRAIVDALKDQYPQGSDLRWGFNMNRESTWIVGESGIDLERLIIEVTGEPPLEQSTIDGPPVDN